MLLLAIESATESVGVSVATEAGLLATVTVERGRRHAESLTPAIEFACRQAGVAPRELDVVAVDVGPGLFTGLRVGVGTAKALAFAVGIPVVTATSLEILAGAVLGTGTAAGRDVVAVVDARRGEVFWARFRAGPGEVRRVGEERLGPPPELVADLAGGDPALLVGDGARRYRDDLSGTGELLGGPLLAHPPVAVLAGLGLDRMARDLGQPAAAVVPHYLRDADARINWEQRIAPRPVEAPS